MSNYKVDITGINTSTLKCLTHEENMALFKALKEGDPNAKDELVNGNLKLVLSILKGFNKHNLNMDDLVSPANNQKITGMTSIQN